MILVALALVGLQTSLNVITYGAVADGKTDCTVTFQNCIDDAAHKHVPVVDVPSGNYLFTGNLVLPPGISLKGSWLSVPSHTGIRDQGGLKPTDGGTTFLCTGSTGTSYNALTPSASDKPAFITLNTDCTLQGVEFYYPRQLTDNAPTKYPFTIAMRGNNPCVKDVELLNSYDGVDATQNQRFLIRNVSGQPLHRGVVVDAIYDIGRIENVHFNPWFSFKSPVFDWEMANGIAFEFARSDWQYVTNTFCFGYHVGYQFDETKSGVCNGNFSGIGADDCETSVNVENCASYGLLITNGEFTSFEGPDPTMVRVAPTNKGVVRFNNCSFWGPCHQIALIEGSGTVAFSNCSFVQWDRDHVGLPAIDVRSGNIMVTGCDFQQAGNTIKLGPNVSQPIVNNNLIIKPAGK